MGVIFASVSAGLGELSFLFFSRDVLGGWGSGTGGAGVAGALLYSGLTQAGLSPRNTLLIMLVVPVAMVISYFFLLVFPPSFPQWKCREVESVRGRDSQSRQPLLDDTDEEEEREKGAEEDKVTGPLTCIEKLHITKGLLRFVVPLGVVYFAEYFINQGLLELLYFPNFSLSHAEQYRWYQTLYQVGVLVSRSSLCCVKFRRIWALSLLQCVNAVLLLLSVYYQFLPSAWLVFVIVLYEGLLGGAAHILLHQQGDWRQTEGVCHGGSQCRRLSGHRHLRPHSFPSPQILLLTMRDSRGRKTGGKCKRGSIMF